MPIKKAPEDIHLKRARLTQPDVLVSPSKFKDIHPERFKVAGIGEMTRHWNPTKLKDGFNVLPDGENIFYISNSPLGLWTKNG